jgi:CheY-like chemotaxis protein
MAAPLTARAPGLRVLVVDDDRNMADVVGGFLSTRGCAARVAYDGPSALAAAPEFCPDVVLLDIDMPGMNGYEVARRLRAVPALDGAALLAFTGHADQEHRRQSNEAGMALHLVKPMELQELLDVLAGFARGGRNGSRRGLARGSRGRVATRVH